MPVRYAHVTPEHVTTKRLLNPYYIILKLKKYYLYLSKRTFKLSLKKSIKLKIKIKL